MPELDSMTIEETDNKNLSRWLMSKDLLLVLIAGSLFTAFALQWSFQKA
jgi:hypothetical protein